MAQYDIPRHTVDGGGAMFSTGGSFTLSMTQAPSPRRWPGGTFELVGGFWAHAPSTCACLGDMNACGERDGTDVQTFVECMTIG